MRTVHFCVFLVFVLPPSVCLPAAMAQEEAPPEYAEPGEYAESAPVHDASLLVQTFRALGLFYTVVLPLAAFFSFVLTVLLVIRGGQYAGAAIVLVVPLPFLIGLYGFFEWMIVSFNVIASASSAPRPAEVAMGVATALYTPLVGLLLMVPSYLVATGGLFLRALIGQKSPHVPQHAGAPAAPMAHLPPASAPTVQIAPPRTPPAPPASG